MVLPRLPLIGEVMDRTLKFDLPSHLRDGVRRPTSESEIIGFRLTVR